MTSKKLIAIGVSREGQMWEGHFGESPQYAMYDHDGKLVETRANPYGDDGDGHRHHGNPSQIVELLPECAVFIARRMGKPREVEKLGIHPVITSETEPQAALAAYLKAD